jgi:hypothetical protein
MVKGNTALARSLKMNTFQINCYPLITVTVKEEKGSDKYVSVSVDPSLWTQEVKDHVFANGVSQIIRDACANGKNLEEKKALLDKKVEALNNGTLRAPRESGDPITAVAMKMAKAVIAKKLGSAVFKELSASEVNAKAKAAIEANPAFMVKAKAHLDMMAELTI